MGKKNTQSTKTITGGKKSSSNQSKVDKWSVTIMHGTLFVTNDADGISVHLHPLGDGGIRKLDRDILKQAAWVMADALNKLEK